MPVFSFQSESLNASTATNSALRMLVGVNGVSLLAKNNAHILALKYWNLAANESGFQSVESDLRNIFGSERLLDLAFESKTCCLASAATTLVPRRLFAPDHLDQYFKLLLREGGSRSYGFEKLEAFDCYLVWAAETGLLRLCEQYFSPQNIGHLGSSLLRSYHEMSPTDGYAVFANLRGQKVQVAVFERRNLLFFNTYDFSKPSDLLYFILLAYKQFELSPLEIPLTLSGTLLEDSEIFRLLMRYVRPMRFPALPAGFRLPEPAKTLPEHYWFDLLTC